MTKVLVVSDSHGNQRFLRQVLQAEHDAEIIVHLGDYYNDLEENYDLTDGKTVYRVPGIFNSGYFSGKLSPTCVFEVNNWRIGGVHAPQDIPKLPGKFDVILSGHTHSPKVEKLNLYLHINPGHLKNLIDRGNIASYAVLEISDEKINVKIRQINCNLKEEYSFIK
ncbi:MAG: YfcE family phosphodiesterase [Candidatus Stygibacter frigidus]|nr:YfcE family phosphodiesterase [Candidatus Stygibacter frigidus]